MFSYFSSSHVECAIDNENNNEAVTVPRTLRTDHSSICNNGINCNDAINPGSKTLNDVQKVTNVAPATSASWNKAHDLYCTKHKTLSATIQQVLSEVCEENQKIPWEFPNRSNPNVVVEAKEMADLLQIKRGEHTANILTTPRKLSASSWLMSPLKIVSAVASIVRDSDDDIDEWIQEGDDAFIDDEENCVADHSSSITLGLNTPVINMNMTESAIHYLENEIGHISTDTPLVMGLMEWDAWARSSLSKHHINCAFYFSVNDHNFLLQVLVHLNKARIIRRGNSKPKGLDVVVLSSKVVENNNDNCISEYFRVPISLWDIQEAEKKIEHQLQGWSEQAAECIKKALKYKKQNQMKISAIQLAKRRIIQKRIDSDSRLQIQLLQTRNAIESSLSNRSMIGLMADSTKLLRQFREQISIEEVHETIDGLQYEIDGLQEINNNLSISGDDVTNTGTEEELLEELKKLSMNYDPIIYAPDTSTAIQTNAPQITRTEKQDFSEKVNSRSSCRKHAEPQLA